MSDSHPGAKYGHVDGYPVGTVFQSRRECHECGVHRGLVSGISYYAPGGGSGAAYSVVVSGGYEDDDDQGDTIIYTGEGGRDSSGSRQIADQEWKGANQALYENYRNHKKVRVIRGHNLKSKYAPSVGFRYDGLYYVTEARRVKGKEDYLVYQFKLQRCPGQLPIPTRSESELASQRRRPATTRKRHSKPPKTIQFRDQRDAAARALDNDQSTINVDGVCLELVEFRPTNRPPDVNVAGPSTSMSSSASTTNTAASPTLQSPISTTSPLTVCSPHPTPRSSADTCSGFAVGPSRTHAAIGQRKAPLLNAERLANMSHISASRPKAMRLGSPRQSPAMLNETRRSPSVISIPDSPTECTAECVFRSVSPEPKLPASFSRRTSPSVPRAPSPLDRGPVSTFTGPRSPTSHGRHPSLSRRCMSVDEQSVISLSDDRGSDVTATIELSDKDTNADSDSSSGVSVRAVRRPKGSIVQHEVAGSDTTEYHEGLAGRATPEFPSDHEMAHVSIPTEDVQASEGDEADDEEDDGDLFADELVRDSSVTLHFIPPMVRPSTSGWSPADDPSLDMDVDGS